MWRAAPARVAGGSPVASLVVASLVAAGGAAAQLDLTEAQRDAFGAEIRALLLDEPEIVDRALSGPYADADPYADAVADDLSLIARHEAALFDAPADRTLGAGPVWIVAFVDLQSPAGQAVLEQLDRVAAQYPGIAVRHVTTGHVVAGEGRTAQLLQTLGLTLLPGFVTRRALIRGEVPDIVLLRAGAAAAAGQ